MSIHDIKSRKRNRLDFTGPWLAAIGKPELKGTWFVYADSGHGKTTFVFQLCKYLCSLGLRVGYNSKEEGDSAAIEEVIDRVDMSEVKRKFQFYDKFDEQDMRDHLAKRNAPNVMVLDSWTFLDMTTKEYKRLEEDHPNTLFIVVGHEKNGQPRGNSEVIHKLAHVKIRVLGFKAYVKSRYGGIGTPIVVWEEGAAKYQTI